MGQFSGMDIEGVRALAAQMRLMTADISRGTKAINTKIRHVPWKGKDSDKFLNVWDSDLHQRLASGAKDLEIFAEEAEKQAYEQEAISSQ